MTGSAFSTTLTIPTEGFETIAGETVIGGIHGDEARHWHCDHCKSWVYTTGEPDMGFVNLRATLLDDARWFVPYAEMQTAERLPWVETPAERCFERFPEMADYEDLIAEFAEMGARPG